jgi:hypothetical protein
VKHEKPANIGKAEWSDVLKAISIITEHYANVAIFLNWVDDEGETQHCHILKGNELALQNHVGKWVDGDYDDAEDDDDSELKFK